MRSWYIIALSRFFRKSYYNEQKNWTRKANFNYLDCGERDQLGPMVHVPDDTHEVILLYYTTQHNRITQLIESSSATRLSLQYSKCGGCINRQRQEETVIHSKPPPWRRIKGQEKK